MATCSPRAPPGLFVWTILDSVGLAGQSYKANRSLANLDGTIKRRAASLAPGVDAIGDTGAEVRSLNRQLAKKMEDADTLEEKLDIMDEDGVPDTDPKKIAYGEELLELQGEIESFKKDLSDLGVTKDQLTATLVHEKNELVKGQRNSSRLSGQLRRSEVKAKLMNNAAAFNPTGHDTVPEAEELVRQQIDKNEGRADAARAVFGKSDADLIMDGRVKNRKTANFLAERRKRNAPDAPAPADSSTSS